MMTEKPTPYADVNAILVELVSGISTILGNDIIGIYLDGSLAHGDFDTASDIDFVVITTAKITDVLFTKLHAMHARLNAGESHWATQLEGSYFSQYAVRRHNPVDALHPNIERGRGEQLKWVQHDTGWAVHRSILCECGIVIEGPAPHTLIDPVSPDDLRGAMRDVLSGWGAQLLAEPHWLNGAGYQSYVVLSLCRILYTLDTGAVVSKHVAAEWAKPILGDTWRPLIE